MDKNKRIYLIDGMSIVFRAYHALSRSGLRTSNNEPTYAVFAFANIITSLLEKEKPEYIAVLFDTQEPTFRHKIFPEYKSNRQAFPEDLVPQLKRIKELLDAMRIKRIELPGFEADDVIGTMAKRFSAESWEVVCITNDKDFFQLVDDKIKIYKTGKNLTEGFELIDEDKVVEKFGVPPNKVVDVLAIVGDPVDNVPGIKGIGDKTAIPLVQQFGSLEDIYAKIEEIPKESIKEKFLEYKNEAFLSKQLVTIDVNTPVDFSIEELKFQEPDIGALDRLFLNLDFKTLRQRWLEKYSAKGIATEPLDTLETQFKTIDNIQKKYILVNSTALFDELLHRFQSASFVTLDTETSSLDKQNCELVGLSFAFTENEAFYLPVYGTPKNQAITEKNTKNITEIAKPDLFSQDDYLAGNKLAEAYATEYNPVLGFEANSALSKLKPFLESREISKIGQNIKFDSYVLKRYGVDIFPIEFDTMVASYILNPDEQHNLDALAKKWLGYLPISISKLIGEKKSTQISMRALKPEDVSEYACEDADVTLKLRNILYKELEKEKLLSLAKTVEFPLIEVLTQMEFNGVYVDKEILKSISEILNEEVANVKRIIFAEAGIEFNLDSPKQLGQVLFEKLNLPVIAKTKTGYSTDVGVLTQLSESYPIARNILEYRSMTKLLSTYVDALPELINRETGRIHTTFNQTIASTGRLSSTEPNLQNIPIRSEFGKEIRKAFTPQKKHWKILSADYSQIELRIVAHISGDKNLIDAFKKGLDIHAATASLLFDKPIEQIDSNMRRVAKTVNFGILYGLGSYGLSQRLGLSRAESQKIIDDYLTKYSGIKKYVEDIIQKTAKKGYAETLCGRRRYFPNITSKNRNLRSSDERAAINFPVQGTAADMMKLAMIGIHSELKKHKLRTMMTLQIHDELVFEVPDEELELVKSLIKERMEGALSLGEVPIVVDIGLGESWFDAH
jgi:DNA polymerase-1